MIQVVGGTYFELCREPEWYELFGSGLRAAAALAELSDGCTLHTYVAEKDRKLLASLANSFGLSLGRIVTSHDTVAFDYPHGLCAPSIVPPPHLIHREEHLRIQGDNIVRFGMLEGDAVVCGERVVYDPQSAFDPRPFEENGSSAEELAVVGNLAEWRKLTGLPDIAAMCKELHSNRKWRVSVVKMGARGALLITASEVTLVPVFETAHVFPIGSGDVFAAAFGHFWCEEHLEPRDAATSASKAVAFYCDSAALPLPCELAGSVEGAAQRLSRPFQAEEEKGGQVYLAGPFFNAMQRWVVNEMRTALLSLEIQVFSPLHDVGRGPAEDVAERDIEGLENSSVVLAVVDGLDPGTLFEIGYARARGIPVIAFAQNAKAEDMKMISGTGGEVCNDLATCVYRAAWKALRGGT